MSQHQQGNDPFTIVYIAGAVIFAFMALGMYYGSHKAIINYYIMTINWYELRPLSLIDEFLHKYPESDAYKAIYKIKWNNPEKYTFEQMVALTGIVGSYLKYPFGLILTCLLINSYRNHGVAESYTTVYNMTSLLQNNVYGFPCMKPVAFRNLLAEPLDSGPWKVARTPLQFCVENELIVDKAGKPVPKHLILNQQTGLADIKSVVLRNGENKDFKIDKEKAIGVLTKQLGTPFSSFDDLAPYQQAIAACCMAFIGGDKEKGQKMLNQLSASFEEGTEAKNMSDMKLDVSGVKEMYEKYHKHDHVVYATRYHMSYEKTWLMALLWASRGKGVLACSQFIWLRPTDRDLWYALNQVGGSVAWAEGVAAWSHYKVEELAFMTLHEPELDPAIGGLDHALRLTGFLPFIIKKK